MENKKKFKDIFVIVLKVILSLIIIYLVIFYSLLFLNKYAVSQIGKENPDFPFETSQTGSNELIKIEEKKVNFLVYFFYF